MSVGDPAAKRQLPFGSRQHNRYGLCRLKRRNTLTWRLMRRANNNHDVFRAAIESRSSKLLNGRPTPIATAEQTLPRKTRTILAQLLTGHRRIVGEYMNRIDPTVRNHCHDCGHSPYVTHHLFHRLSKPTTLTVEFVMDSAD